MLTEIRKSTFIMERRTSDLMEFFNCVGMSLKTCFSISPTVFVNPKKPFATFEIGHPPHLISFER